MRKRVIAGHRALKEDRSEPTGEDLGEPESSGRGLGTGDSWKIEGHEGAVPVCRERRLKQTSPDPGHMAIITWHTSH